MHVLRKTPHTWRAVTVLLLVCLVPLSFVAGCTGGPGTQPTATATPAIQVLKVSGSTTVQPIASKAAEAFMANHSTVDIQVSPGGSGPGVVSAGEGTADIGMSSRDLTAAEIAKYPTLVTTTIAKDGVAIIVHPTNGVSVLSLDQVKSIYNGSITNWNQVGGPNMAIVVVGRESSSGTRAFVLEKIMKNQNFTSTQLETNSNGAMKQTISQTPGAIGYVSIGFLDATVKAVSLGTSASSVAPTVANVLNGSYPVSRPLYFLTKGTPAGLAKEFTEYVLSPVGQQLVAEEGYVPL